MMAIGIAVPASAITLNLNTGYGTCNADGQSPTLAARVSNMGCSSVRASVRYVTSGGAVTWLDGPISSTVSAVSSPTSMMTGRGAFGSKNGSWSDRVTY